MINSGIDIVETFYSIKKCFTAIVDFIAVYPFCKGDIDLIYMHHFQFSNAFFSALSMLQVSNNQ
jgi:hypothetical protein